MELNSGQRAARYQMLSRIDRTSSYSGGEPARSGLEIASVQFPMGAEVLMQAVGMKSAIRTRREQIGKRAESRVRSPADVLAIYREHLAETRRAYRHKLIGEIVPASMWTDDSDRILPDMDVLGFAKPLAVPSWMIFEALLSQDEADVLDALKTAQPRNVDGVLKHEVSDADMQNIFAELEPLAAEIASFEKKHRVTSDHYTALFFLLHWNEASTGGRCDATGRATKDRTLCNFLADLDAGASEPYCTGRHFKPTAEHRFAYNRNSESFHFNS